MIRKFITLFPVIMLAIGLGLVSAKAPGKLARTTSVQPEIVRW